MQMDIFGQAATSAMNLEVISIVGKVFKRGEFLTPDSVEDFSNEDAYITDIEYAKVVAERVSLLKGVECWVVNRAEGEHKGRVVYRFSALQHFGHALCA